MNMQSEATQNLASLVATANAHKGSWKNVQLTQDIKMSLWSIYDSNDDLIYPNIYDWMALLEKTMSSNDYKNLSNDEVLSILFGLVHHTRIVEGSWESMFEQGVAQKLLKQLLALSTDKY